MITIKKATLLQFAPPKVEPDIDIVIDQDKIVAVGHQAANEYRADKAIDMDGCIVMPGLVCSHNHFYSGLARGITANIPPSDDFVSILQNLWWRVDKAIDSEILHYSGLICALEAIKAGTTSVIDHHSSPSLVRGSLSILGEAFEKVGLRGIDCYEVTDRNGIKEMEEGIEENIAFAKSIANAPLLEAMIGGHAPFTLPDAALGMMREAMQETGKGIHIHVAEDLFDVSHSHAVYRQDLIKRLHRFELLNGKGIIAHGTHLPDSDIDILNETDCFLVHNSRSNMNNGVGYNRKLDRFHNLALGTDGIGSDMFEELKFAYFKHKDDKGAMWPDSYLQYLQNGNTILERCFGERFGRIEAGYKADLTVLDYVSPTPLNADNIAGHMAFGMNSQNVRTVIVDGRIVYEDRRFPFDEKPMARQAQQAAQRLWERVDGM